MNIEIRSEADVAEHILSQEATPEAQPDPELPKGIVIVERHGAVLLGERNRSDKLVEWSQKQNPGTLFQQELPCGLMLAFYAQGSEPRMHIHFNPAKFHKLRQQAGEQSRFLVVSWGFAIEHWDGRTRVRLLAAGKPNSPIIWDSADDFCKHQEDADTNFLRGMICFSEKGPLFYSELPEEELSSLNNLAVIDTGKQHAAQRSNTVTVGEALAPKEATEQAPSLQQNCAAVFRKLRELGLSQ